MQPDSLLLRELLLLQFELRGQVEQADFLLFFRNDFIEKRQVIAEKQDARGIVDLGVFADVVLKEIAAIGVTYSWLKRRSARAKPVSPGLTQAVARAGTLAPTSEPVM